MTTQSDDSSRTDQTAAAATPDATNETTRATKGKKGARSNTAAAAQAAARAAHPAAHPVTPPATPPAAGAPITQELPAMDWAPTGQGDEDEDDEGATREVAAVSSGDLTPPAAPVAPVADADAASEPAASGDDPDATVVRAQPAAAESRLDQPMTEPAPPRPRYNTLAGAFNRSRASASDPAAPGRAETPSEPLPPPSWTPPPPPMAHEAQDMATPTEPDAYDDFLDEVDDGEDEWSLADQPTVQWTPQQIQQMQQLKPNFSPTGEQPSWPPRASIAAEPESDASHHDWRVGLPPRPQPPFPLNGAPRGMGAEPRLASPDGRVAPPPPSASVAGAQPDPRMERFQELRRQRVAHGQGERDDSDAAPVAESVRQWWNDVFPMVQKGLHVQREARASGMHPIPAYEATAVSRMGDAFGRLAASARELSERAQQAVEPTIKRIHDQVEQAAQGIISRFEGDPVRQQAPLLGPGRIAIFFRQGVSVGQAQRLLAASAARPMRLIPRKHGFLARVQQGKEAEVCERLRQHPYVSDVVYLEFNEYGEPVGGRR